jgi:hypothetical protein
MSKKQGIPDMQGVPSDVAAVLGPVKANLEFLMGRTGTKIAVLGPTASTADCINKINEIINLLQSEQ